MHTVATAFTTSNRRFLPGQEVTEADCDSPEHFARLVELKHIVKGHKDEPAAEAVARDEGEAS